MLKAVQTLEIKCKSYLSLQSTENNSWLFILFHLIFKKYKMFNMILTT